MSEEQDHDESTDAPEEDSLRDTLETAISASEEEGEGVHEGESSEAKDESGVLPVSDAQPEGETPPAEAAKAPVDWDASLREQWGSLPPAVQEKVLAREQQVNQVMQEASQARRMAQEMSGLFQTYGSVISAEGAQNPMQGVQSLLQTVSELRMGSPAQKAQKMAQLIKHYGVGINELDQALVGEKIEENTPENIQALVNQQVQQQLAPFQQQQVMAQQQEQMRYQQQAVSEVDKFAESHEFLADVRQDMADLIDLATHQGRDLTLEEAYNKPAL